MGNVDRPRFNPARPDLKPMMDLSRTGRLRDNGSHLGWDWWNLRRAYLKQHPLCQDCNVHIAEEVHHVIPRSKRPDLTLDSSNLRALCAKCHASVHAKNA